MNEKGMLVWILLNIVIPVLEIAAFLYLAPLLLRLFLPFVVGWMLAMVATPLVKLLERRLRLVRRHSSVLIIAAVLVFVVLGFYTLISWIVVQAIQMARDLPDLYRILSLQLREIFLQYDHVFALLPDGVQEILQRITGNIGEAAGLLVQQIATPTVEAAGVVAKSIPSVFVNVIVTILSAYLFIVDQDQHHNFVRKYAAQYVPDGWKTCWRYLCEDGKSLMGGYFLAQARIMVVVAAILVTGFLILQVRYSLLLGVLVAVLDFLPLFGTGTVLIPWALLEVCSARYSLAAGLALLYVLTQVVRQMIQPKIVGETLGLSPMWTLVFLYLGFQWHGLSGMVLAVPLGIMVMRLAEHGMFDAWMSNVKGLWELIRQYRGK